MPHPLRSMQLFEILRTMLVVRLDPKCQDEPFASQVHDGHRVLTSACSTVLVHDPVSTALIATRAARAIVPNTTRDRDRCEVNQAAPATVRKSAEEKITGDDHVSGVMSWLREQTGITHMAPRHGASGDHTALGRLGPAPSPEVHRSREYPSIAWIRMAWSGCRAPIGPAAVRSVHFGGG